MNTAATHENSVPIMISQLRKIDDESVLVLAKPLLDLLGLEENADVQLSVQEGSLVITPANPTPIDRGRFNELLDQLVENRRDVLQRLAQ